MGTRSDIEEFDRIEAALGDLFHHPKPDPDFVRLLKQQLIARGPAISAERNVLLSWLRPMKQAASAVALGFTVILMALMLNWALNNLIPGRSTGGGPAETTTPSATGTPQLDLTSTPQSQVATSLPVDLAPLSMDSSSDEIRQRMLNSHTFWNSLWIDGQIIYYSPDGSQQPSQYQRTQIWIEQPARTRLLTGTPNGAPNYLWISDGEKLRNGEDVPAYIREGEFLPPEDVRGTVYPHPMTGFLPTPLSEMLFPAGFAQREGTFRPVSQEIVAGRNALVIEWALPQGQLVDRSWVDTQTGIVLHQQNYGKDGGGTLTQEIILSTIQYDLSFPSETFDRLADFPPAFASGPEDIFTAAQAGEMVAQATLSAGPELAPDAGEVYLVLERNGYEAAGLVHFPAACLVSGQPCPIPEFVPGFPADEISGSLLSWSPDGQRMVYPTSSIMDQVLVFDRLAQAWDTLDSPYFSGAVWSPDGGWLAGQPIIYGNPTSNPLLLVRADGGEWRNLLEDEPGFKSPLGWMDENRIVFLQVLDNVEPSFHARVQVFDLKSGALVPLQEISYEEGLNGPVLSPDGSHLAFGIDRASPYEITLLDIASGSATTIEVSVQGGLGWSPDGRWLIITAALGFSCEIHLVSPDGLETHKVFTGDWGGACNNTWSPDGDYLLVSANAQNPTVPRLYVISIADGESWLVELPDVGVEFEWPRAYWVP